VAACCPRPLPSGRLPSVALRPLPSGRLPPVALRPLSSGRLPPVARGPCPVVGCRLLPEPLPSVSNPLSSHKGSSAEAQA
ncbi:unnamed protein product, partial [Staurois parvus]